MVYHSECINVTPLRVFHLSTREWSIFHLKLILIGIFHLLLEIKLRNVLILIVSIILIVIVLIYIVKWWTKLSRKFCNP